MALFFPAVMTLLLLIGIVCACSIFTNAIEWLGHRFKLSEGAVGSVLAAVGTALPETLVPIIALVGGAIAAHTHPEMAALFKEEAAEIGIGAILGAPFLLSTLAMFLSGAAVFYFSWKKKRETKLNVNIPLFKRDLGYFFLAYLIVIAATMFQAFWFKCLIAIILLGIYGVYVWRTLSIEHIPDEDFHLEPLTIAPRSKEPATALIVMQTLLGLAGIMVLAHLFVQQIKTLSSLFQISSMVLSLIIAPIATELPEKFNSVVWISKKKDSLALGNITGAMVFQSCIPTSIGILFTPWVLDMHGQLSVMLCFASAGIMFISVMYRQKLLPQILLVGGFFYAVFLLNNIFELTHKASP